ncbi:hypothetical protein [Actinotignum sp. GS-2025b]|uniref:hypothetical protein n=1 Tax=Actinotignum sp. GS-2025b TaxID=3427275 RepID=UPI003F473CB8
MIEQQIIPSVASSGLLASSAVANTIAVKAIKTVPGHPIAKQILACDKTRGSRGYLLIFRNAR